MFFLGFFYTLTGIVLLIFLDDKTGGKLNDIIDTSNVILLIVLFFWPAAALWLALLWLFSTKFRRQAKNNL
jgi:hypothetical protein